MKMFRNIASFIGHYGLVNFLIISTRKIIRAISLLKFSYLIKSGKINSPVYISNDLNEIRSHILKKYSLGFENNIRTIKQKNLYPEQVRQILFEADHFCNNTFNILNSGWIKWEYQGNIDWHSDKKSDHRYESRTFYRSLSSKIRTQIRSGKKIKADLKVPRELSRFHFLFGLYFAYIYSGKIHYLDKIKDSILNWIDTNPPYKGINWSNAMEVAIRISNWTLIVFELKDKLLQDQSFEEKFYTSLYQHNLYIHFNKENLILLNNHYMADISGLFVSNLFFPVFKYSEKWLQNASGRIKQEMMRQIHPDGGDFESSTPYQRLVTELLFLPLYLNKQFKTHYFGSEHEFILKKMFAFILNTLKPSRKIIQFGDNDDGRYFKLYDRPSLDHSYLPALSFGIFNDQYFCLKEIPFDILAFIFYGEEVFLSYLENQKSIYSLPPIQFKDSGVYILRNNQVYLAVSCMPNGMNGYGVHTHNDKLSFELTFRDIDIIVDPGTYLYSSDPVNRNLYRSTLFHNTVVENRQEQNDFGEDVFRLKNDTNIQVLKSEPDYLHCQHNGFLKKGGSLHQRQFRLESNRVLITDILEKDLPSQSFLHFAEHLELHQENKEIHVVKDGKTICGLIIKNADDIQIIEYQYSPAYALQVPCYKLKLEFKKELNIELINLN